MEILSHTIKDTLIAQVISDQVLINNLQDATDLLGNVYYNGFDKMVISEQNLTPDFFDLKNKLAGDILQKFSNYRVSLAIVGEFSKFPGKSLQDFIFESNKGTQVCFVSSLQEGLATLSRQ